MFFSLLYVFYLCVSGVQLVAGRYLAAGVPALFISGVVPLLSSFWNSHRAKKHHHEDESEKDGSSICESCECLDIGNGSSWWM